MTGQKGEAAVDRWTMVHGIGGGTLGLFAPWGAVTILALLVLYELVEGGLRRVPGSNGGGVFEHESWKNILTDIAVAWVMWGFVAGMVGGWPLDWT